MCGGKIQVRYNEDKWEDVCLVNNEQFEAKFKKMLCKELHKQNENCLEGLLANPPTVKAEKVFASVLFALILPFVKMRS